MHDPPSCLFPVVLVTRLEIFLIKSQPAAAGDASGHGACTGGLLQHLAPVELGLGCWGTLLLVGRAVPPSPWLRDAAVGGTLGWGLAFMEVATGLGPSLHPGAMLVGAGDALRALCPVTAGSFVAAGMGF